MNRRLLNIAAPERVEQFRVQPVVRRVTAKRHTRLCGADDRAIGFDRQQDPADLLRDFVSIAQEPRDDAAAHHEQRGRRAVAPHQPKQTLTNGIAIGRLE